MQYYYRRRAISAANYPTAPLRPVVVGPSDVFCFYNRVRDSRKCLWCNQIRASLRPGDIPDDPYCYCNKYPQDNENDWQKGPDYSACESASGRHTNADYEGRAGNCTEKSSLEALSTRFFRVLPGFRYILSLTVTSLAFLTMLELRRLAESQQGC